MFPDSGAFFIIQVLYSFNLNFCKFLWQYILQAGLSVIYSDFFEFHTNALEDEFYCAMIEYGIADKSENIYQWKAECSHK